MNRDLKPEQRPDGWYLVGDQGEVVGPFATEADMQAFLRWLESLPAEPPTDGPQP